MSDIEEIEELLEAAEAAEAEVPEVTVGLGARVAYRNRDGREMLAFVIARRAARPGPARPGEFTWWAARTPNGHLSGTMPVCFGSDITTSREIDDAGTSILAVP